MVTSTHSDSRRVLFFYSNSTFIWVILPKGSMAKVRQLGSDDLIPKGKAATLTLRLNSTDFRLSARKALSGP